MVPLESTIEQTIISLYVLEELLKQEGFVIGPDQDSGYFDYLIDDESYYYLRIPFYAVAGSLDYPGVTVRVDKPFLLAPSGTAEDGAIRGAVDQFQVPTNPDADIPSMYMDMGKNLLRKVEGLLIPSG